MERRTNILLVTADALRADHLGCYGYAHDTSPFLDEMAGQGALCEAMFCSAIPTQPSYTSLFTGQDPITHGIVCQGGRVSLSKQAPFLPQLLLPAGYTTCAIDNLLREKVWFSRGFEFYIDPSLKRTLLLGVTAEELNARAVPWIRRHRNETFFLHIHYWDPHYPLKPPARYQDLFYDKSRNPCDPGNRTLDPWWKHPLGALARDTWLRTAEGLVTDPEYLVALYDREIRHFDDGLADLVTALKSAGLEEKTLVVVMADHGESLTEHGIFCEHHGLYDCTIRIPFVARMPGRIPAGRRLEGLLQVHDIAPTLLEAAGLSRHAAMDGQSFWPLLTGESDEGFRDAVVCCECSWQAKWCLRDRHRKLIRAREPDAYGNPERELYDLVADPGETRNLESATPDLAGEMEAELEAWVCRRLEETRRGEDPLVEQGISLGSVLRRSTS